MYALIYDEFDPAIPGKAILSLHKTRSAAEKELMKRQRDLGKRVWECHTRIVWLHDTAKAGDVVTPDGFDTWAPGEAVPTSEQVPECD